MVLTEAEVEERVATTQVAAVRGRWMGQETREKKEQEKEKIDNDAS